MLILLKSAIFYVGIVIWLIYDERNLVVLRLRSGLGLPGLGLGLLPMVTRDGCRVGPGVTGVGHRVGFI